MKKPFSIQTALRMIPRTLLVEFFEKLGHTGFDPGWTDLPKREIDPIMYYLAELPLAQLNELEGVLHNISDLACSSGFDALLEAGKCLEQPDIGILIPEDLCLWGRSMWAWLNVPAVFEQAQVIHQIDNLAWWRKRNDVPATEPDISGGGTANLVNEVTSLLSQQGRGKDCSLDHFERGNVDYFFVYPDDMVQNVIVHNEDSELVPMAFRPTLLIVFAYDRVNGSLETYAKLGKSTKEKLEVVFARSILHWDLADYDPDAAYELNQLKESSFDLKTDPEDRVRVCIRKMRLASKHCGRRLNVEVDDDPEDNIHKAIQECLDLENIPLSQWNATRVTFCFEFLPQTGRKHGRQSFDVSYPRSCGLRNARPERVELIQKYLKRWNIDRLQSSKPDLVAVAG